MIIETLDLLTKGCLIVAGILFLIMLFWDPKFLFKEILNLFKKGDMRIVKKTIDEKIAKEKNGES